jgi:hypothetical protein
MRRIFAAVLLVLAVASSTAAAQATSQQGSSTALTWSALEGDWVGTAMRPGSDTLITNLTISFSADQKIWVTFPNGDPIPGRVVAMAGDSIVTEIGPYSSITRPGRTVTTRLVSHVGNHKLWGTIRGTFNDGTTSDADLRASHKMP